MTRSTMTNAEISAMSATEFIQTAFMEVCQDDDVIVEEEDLDSADLDQEVSHIPF